MNQEENIILIQLYRDYRHLWDAKDKDHHNRAMRQDAWREISTEMGQPVGVLKARMRSLMGSYRSEKSREKRSRTGTEDRYQSKWFAYKFFDFLNDRDDPRGTAVAEDKVSRSSEAEAAGPPPQRIRRKRKLTSESAVVMVETLKLLQTSTATWGDPEHAYALHVASELRKYDQRTLAHVKKAIADVLFQADLGGFSSEKPPSPLSPSMTLKCDDTDH